MNSLRLKQNELILGLISKGLEKWVKSKCQGISELKIKIFGELEDLLNGHLNRLELKAKKINYKGLHFSNISLRSSSLNIKLNIRSLYPRVELKKEFSIKATSIFSEKDLLEILLSKRWNWLKEYLCFNDSSSRSIQSVKIKGDVIEFHYLIQNQSIYVEKVKLYSINGGILVKSISSGKDLKFPIESKIFVEAINFNHGKLCIKGKGLVSPEPNQIAKD